MYVCACIRVYAHVDKLFRYRYFYTTCYIACYIIKFGAREIYNLFISGLSSFHLDIFSFNDIRFSLWGVDVHEVGVARFSEKACHEAAVSPWYVL